MYFSHTGAPAKSAPTTYPSSMKASITNLKYSEPGIGVLV